MTKEKLHIRAYLTKIQRTSLTMAGLVLALTTFQTINGKYEDEHITLAWFWTLSLIVPIPMIVTILKTNTKRRFNENALQSLKGGHFLTTIYFSLLLAVILIVMPLAWLNAGIGYVPIFKNSLWGFILLQVVIAFLILSSVRYAASQGIKAGTEIREKRDFDNDDTAYAGSIVLKNKKEASAVIANCRKQIRENKIPKAFQLLEGLFEKEGVEEPMELTLIESQWNKVERETRLGLIDSKEASLKFANLIEALLILLTRIEGK